MQPGQHCCRGVSPEPYNISSQVCCGTGTDKVVFEDHEAEPNLYQEDFMCCRGNHLWPHEPDSACCGGHPYKLDSQGCCNDVTYEKDSKMCCNDTIYDPEIEHCCESQVFKKANLLGSIYYSEFYMCCQERFLHLRGDNNSCCGTEPYQQLTHRCDNGKIVVIPVS